LVIGLGGSNSPGVFVIASPSAPARPGGGWLCFDHTFFPTAAARPFSVA
jgi:hypothetical protein